MHALIHIGMEKTGTTSIQQFLTSNRTPLLGQGVLVPRSLGPLPPRCLVMLGIESGTLVGDHRLAGLRSADEVSGYVRARTEELDLECAAAKPRSVVLTNERLSSRLTTPARVRQFSAWVSERFNDVSIVVYLRRQDSMLLAMYSTLIKVGGTAPFEVPSLPDGAWDRYDYASMLDLWGECFGHERLRVGVFEPGRLAGGDVVEDFCATAGIDRQGLRPVAATNTSLTAEGVEVLRLLNQHIPYESPRQRPVGGGSSSPGVNHLRSGLVAAVEEATRAGHPLEWTGGTSAADFLHRYDEGNRRIAERYLGRKDGLLFDTAPPRSASEQQRSLTVEEVAAVSASLWVYQRQRLEAAEQVRRELRQKNRQLTQERREVTRRTGQDAPSAQDAGRAHQKLQDGAGVRSMLARTSRALRARLAPRRGRSGAPRGRHPDGT